MTRHDRRYLEQREEELIRRLVEQDGDDDADTLDELGFVQYCLAWTEGNLRENGRRRQSAIAGVDFGSADARSRDRRAEETVIETESGDDVMKDLTTICNDLMKWGAKGRTDPAFIELLAKGVRERDAEIARLRALVARKNAAIYLAAGLLSFTKRQEHDWLIEEAKAIDPLPEA